MNNIYIGARYVPKFFENSSGTSEWTANTAYEPLTIVTKNGNSYTSKKLVPASVGAPEDNADYWVSTGIYNQQVEEYRQEVETYRQDVETYRQEIESVTDDIDELAAEVRSEPRHIVVIGDSFTTNNGGGTTLSQDLGQALAGVLGWNASYIHFNGRNSAGFYNDYFIDQLNSLAAGISSAVRPLVKDLYVVGGWNDHNDTEANVRAKAAVFRTQALSYFPNAKLHTVYIGYGYKSAISVINTLITTRNVYNTLTGYIPHINAFYTMHDPSLYVAENDHPNNAGMAEIANTMKSIIETGTVNVERQHTINSDLTIRNGSMEASPAYVFRETLSNGITTINMYAVRTFVTLENAETLALHNSTFTLGTIAGLYSRGQQNNYGCAVTIPFYDADYNETLVTGYLTLSDGTINFIPNTMKATSGGNKSISVKYYTFPQFNLTMFSR